MLNEKKERELAYVVKIDGIEPIVGSDNCEAAVVGGWRIMVRKGTFVPGELAVYFEIDSRVPATEEFAFLAKRNYKIKTQKFTFGGKGNFISQGLLMPAEDLGGERGEDYLIIHGKKFHEKDFLTAELKVSYAEADDNKRKAASADKYKKMAQRRPEIFSKKWARWMMKRTWGKKVMFFFFGKKKDSKTAWPTWVVKTDEERIENIPWRLTDKTPWFATEKIDGTSTTFTMKGYGRKRQFYVCSRNVVFDTPDKKCFYDSNVYQEMAVKYNIEETLSLLMEYFGNLKDKEVEFVTLQGETYGAGIQKRDYSLKGHDFMAFNVIVKYVDEEPFRLNPKEMTELLVNYGIPCVPIVDPAYVLPDTIEELRDFVNSAMSAVDGQMKEGIVFRSADGSQSFKCVSPEFLLKYHG